jgi:UDP-GlcNAc3NAcA epimerase
MKVCSIVGARPQFIKAAVVSRALRKSAGLGETLIHTGQHYDSNMSSVFFEELEIPEPDYNLAIQGGSHGEQTGRMLERIERVLMDEKPDCVLVYGDTNSTLAGALAAAKLHIPVAHVEAGLRSFNRTMPEEINRILADHVSALLFAPTETAVHNLQREGVAPSIVHCVGDVMYDAALFYARKAETASSIMARLALEEKTYVLATIHRAENTDNETRLQALFEGLTRVAQHIPVVLPLHPRTRKGLADLGRQRIGKLMVIDPVGYLDMVMLERNARLIATDSGGVQKEAYFYRVPCATLRAETEWTELVQLGWNTLVPPESGKQVEDRVLGLLDAPLPGDHPALYGDGDAASLIAGHLMALRRA